MSEGSAVHAKLEKICLDNECEEAWAKMPSACSGAVRDFVYCPFCSEELHLQCSACKESLANKDFKFCPWCGVPFENE